MRTNTGRGARHPRGSDFESAVRNLYRALHMIDQTNLKSLRESLGLSQQEAAHLARVSTRTWIRYEQKGRKSPWNRAIRSLLDNILEYKKQLAAS